MLDNGHSPSVMEYSSNPNVPYSCSVVHGTPPPPPLRGSLHLLCTARRGQPLLTLWLERSWMDRAGLFSTSLYTTCNTKEYTHVLADPSHWPQHSR